MREIKFRVWSGHHMINDVEKSYELVDFISDNNTNQNYIVLQFTGLKDKNGIEIYEEDIVEYDKHYASNKIILLVIKWDEKNCCYRGMYSKNEGHVLSNFDSKDIKKIGNIYENPELLK